MLAKNMTKVRVTIKQLEQYFELWENEKILRARYGRAFETFKHIRYELMAIVSRRTGNSFELTCLRHVQTIAARKGSEEHKWLDKIFILHVMLEHKLMKTL